LIIVDRQRDGAGSLKASWDRQQAAFLIQALAKDRPDELRRAYATMMDFGPCWRGHIENSLRQMDDTKTILDNI